jgi:hypothetical protein
MRTAQELEGVIREAVDTVIQNGFTLISGDWGICWDSESLQWIWDHTQTKKPGCCPIAALLLVQQPHLAPGLHKGDPYEAAVIALDVDHVWLRNFNNGFERYGYQGGDEDAFILGQQLATMYCPVPCDIVAPTSSSIPALADAASG